MATLVNAYCTHRQPPELSFPHTLHVRRGIDDPELPEHLSGFAQFLASRAGGPLTQSLYHLLQHLKRVRWHYSFELEESAMAQLSQWAWEANAIFFFRDSSVRDPDRRMILDPEGRENALRAEVPYPEDAARRKLRMQENLAGLGLNVVSTLPPVISEVEVELRAASEVAARCLALFATAVRAESLASRQPLEVARLLQRVPQARFSPWEQAFLDSPTPPESDVVQAAWRYEALFCLLWTLGLASDLPFPADICNIPALAETVVRQSDSMVGSARLRPTHEILNALDLHYRIHWCVRQAPHPKVDRGVVQERHHALNWLTGTEDWDTVKTPT